MFSVLCLTIAATAQTSTSSRGSSPTDPGPRRGASGAGSPLTGLSTVQLAAFTDGQVRFQKDDLVTPDGLGPRFNSNSCSSCHAQPAIGGTSPQSNPQVAFANSANQLPPFIQSNGPVREARFIKNPDGTPQRLNRTLILGHHRHPVLISLRAWQATRLRTSTTARRPDRERCLRASSNAD